MSKVLLIEADAGLRAVLTGLCTREGYEVMQARGMDALQKLQEELPDIVVADISLEGLDGLRACKAAREELEVPIVLVTSKESPVDPAMALDNGADDCVVKPFSLGEFAARLRALIRRAHKTPSPRLSSGDLALNLIAHRAFRHGESLELSHKEFDLLAELIGHKGEVLTREALLERIWRRNHKDDTRTVDAHIRLLRAKIEQDPGNPKRIQTIRGVGYRFEG